MFVSPPRFRPVLVMLVLQATLFSERAAAAVLPSSEAQVIPEEVLQRVRAVIHSSEHEWLRVSPTGDYVAWSSREADSLYVLTTALQDLSKPMAKVCVGTNEASHLIVNVPNILISSDNVADMIGSDDLHAAFRMMEYLEDERQNLKGITEAEKERLRASPTPSKLLDMVWISPTRIAVSTNLNVAVLGPNFSINNCVGGLLAFDVNGAHARVLTTRMAEQEKYERVYFFQPLERFDGKHVLIRTASNHVLTVDAETGKSTSSDMTPWQAGKTRRAQTKELLGNRMAAEATRFQAAFPDYKLDVLNSSDDAKVIALLAQSPVDPGHLVVYDSERKRLLDFQRLNEAVHPEDYRVSYAQLSDPETGRHAAVRLIRPQTALHRGVVVLCPEDPAKPLSKAYAEETLVYAAMGYSVLEFGAVDFPKDMKADARQEACIGLLRQIPRWLVSELGAEERPLALAGNTLAGSLLAHRAIWDCSDLYGTLLLVKDRVQEDAPVSKRKHKAGASKGDDSHLDAEVFCAYVGAGYSQYAWLTEQAEHHFEPLQKAGAYVEAVQLAPTTFESHQDENLMLLYKRIAQFLSMSLRPARVRVGPSQVIKEEAVAH